MRMRAFSCSDIFLGVFFFNFFLLSYKSFTCLVKVTPKYFTLFVSIVKGIISLISLSTHYHLFFRGLHFCMCVCVCVCLFFYPVTSLKVFISCRSWLVKFFGSFTYTTLSSEKHSDVWLLPIQFIFI